MIKTIRYRQNKILIIAFSCIAFIVLLMLLLPYVNAAEKAYPLQGLFETLTQPFKAGSVAEMFHINGTYATLYTRLFDTVNNSQYADTGTSLPDLISGIALGLAASYTIYSFFKITLYENRGTKETWIALVVKFIVGGFVIMNIDFLIRTVFNFGTQRLLPWFTELFTGSPHIVETTFTLGADLSNQSFALLFAKQSGGVLIFSLILSLWINIKAYSLLIEMLLRRLVAPLAVSAIVLGGARNPGIRMLKKILVVSIQMIMMYVIFQLGKVVCFYVSSSSEISLFSHSTLYVFTACTYLISKSSKIPEDLIGA